MFRSLRSLPAFLRDSPNWAIVVIAAVPVVAIVLGITGVSAWGQVAMYLFAWSAGPIFATRQYERQHR
jgi:hypothetical protein